MLVGPPRTGPRTLSPQPPVTEALSPELGPFGATPIVEVIDAHNAFEVITFHRNLLSQRRSRQSDDDNRHSFFNGETLGQQSDRLFLRRCRECT